ncbi:MAG: family 1 glycosylhydrolase [Propionivibrio sp.]
MNVWSTLNEPWCSAYLGHASGKQAPGLQNLRYARQAMHHLLLAHGNMIPVLRANDPQAKVGLVANVGYGTPATDAPADAEAARLFQTQHNAWVFDPLFKQSYPRELDSLWPDSAPLVFDGDMETIAAPIDYLGINYYFRTSLKSDGANGFIEVPVDDVETTQLGWEVHPDGLGRLLVEFKDTYANLPPIYITESGMASDDQVVDGEVVDTQRIGFIGGHLWAIDQAMREGVDVCGYFAWSLLDNFEWSYGYAARFGIVHVDYATQKRTPKHSALTIRRFLAERRRENGAMEST